MCDTTQIGLENGVETKKKSLASEMKWLVEIYFYIALKTPCRIACTQFTSLRRIAQHLNLSRKWRKRKQKKMTVKTTAITSKLWRQINNLCVCRFVNVLIKMWMKWKRAIQRVLAKAVHNMKSFRRLSLYWNIFNYILVRHKENLFRLFKWRCFHENDLHCIVCCERQAIFQHYYRVCRNL